MTKKGRIIAIAHQKGGVGKTATAFNIAEQLKPDVIIDQDKHHSFTIINSFRPESERMNVITCANDTSLINALKFKEQGKTVLVDCGGFDSDLIRITIASADLVVTPENGDITEVIGLRSFDKVLKSLSERMGKQVKAHVLFCRIHPSKTNFTEELALVSNSDNFVPMNSVIRDRRDVRKALKKGYGVCGDPRFKGSKSAREFKALVDEINQLTA
ncbi:hypothetical protein A134_23205 [Vibrio crassostreae 9CS106]|uniref:AAA domain-containing protein n=1 Tax=Vibrio crassostreae 9CS106 TaxID=1191300 RepID=A0A1B1C3C3_9VIBR|nr:hypothetical protein A134_23205 [Vibrio crassostreae 9CS106]